MSTGLNSYIEEAIQIFTSDLWVGFNNSFNGRSYRIKTKDGNTIPAIYKGLSSREYSEVLATDKYDSIVHFDIEPNIESVSTLLANIPVNIFFAVNIGKIYGNDIRAVEMAKHDIMRAVQYTSFIEDGYIDQEAYSGIYDLTDKQAVQFNMQPYYVIRIQTNIMTSLGNCEAIGSAVNYALNISQIGNGVTIPATGIYSIKAGETQQLIAAELAGNTFTKWTINGIDSYERVINVVANSAITAIASYDEI